MAHQLLRTVYPQPTLDIAAVLAERNQWDGPLLQRHMDGHLMMTSSTWYLHRHTDGDSFVTELHHDLADLNDTACADVANLLAALAHELSEPLTAITGYLGGMREVLRSPGQDLASVRAATHAAAEQATRAAEAVRLLRHLAATMQRAH
jgi:signal transduction histidine kinase